MNRGGYYRKPGDNFGGTGDDSVVELDYTLHELYEKAAMGHISDAEAQEMLTLSREGRLRFKKGAGAAVLAAPEPEPDGVVYYLRFCCRIKIGTTTNLARRMASIPHDQLLAVEAGGVRQEQRRHEQFAESRINGEWFNETPALMAHIAALKAGVGEVGIRLIITKDACIYTGRDRQTLYRWAKEGRVTKHVKGKGGRILWDVWELPPHTPGKPIPPPPPVLTKVGS